MSIKWVPTPGLNNSSIYDHFEKYVICCLGSSEKRFSLHLETRTSNQRRKHTCQPARFIRTADPQETQWSTIMARLRLVEVNGIRMRIAEEGACIIIENLFYLLLLFGFPMLNIELLLRKYVTRFHWIDLVWLKNRKNPFDLTSIISRPFCIRLCGFDVVDLCVGLSGNPIL